MTPPSESFFWPEPTVSQIRPHAELMIQGSASYCMRYSEHRVTFAIHRPKHPPKPNAACAMVPLKPNELSRVSKDGRSQVDCAVNSTGISNRPETVEDRWPFTLSSTDQARYVKDGLTRAATRLSRSMTSPKPHSSDRPVPQQPQMPPSDPCEISEIRIAWTASARTGPRWWRSPRQGNVVST